VDGGLLVESKDKASNITRYHYDLAGRKRVVVTGLPGAGSLNPAAPIYTGWRYRSGTELVESMRSNAAYLNAADPNSWAGGTLTTYEFDYKLRIVSTTKHVNANTQLVSRMNFDSQGRVSFTTDAYGLKTYPVYDVNDRVIRQVQETVPGGAGVVPNDSIANRENYRNRPTTDICTAL